MSKTHILMYLLLSWATVLSSSCKKEETVDGLRMIDGIPYYHFTDSDKPWLSAQEGEVWRFENQQGVQRGYRVNKVYQQNKADKREYGPPGIPSGTPKLLSYHDRVTVWLSATDSMRGTQEIQFHRDAAMLSNSISGGYDKNRSQFYVEGMWYGFVGNTNLNSDYFNCWGLKFPRGENLNGPFMQITVRGRQYNDVIAFIGTDRGPSCPSAPSSFMQELYYDRRAGMVKMVSKAGEVWERVP
ncbi:hypothetical protein [Hymenobacter sediminicola]|uniref:Uncharacterized protein n=1 Tax=Hymenobacter sediminicola TaxID=2761579 RepID=A0A7G7W381_9BACT|nr:hypothetical protein [Hymenobacter sediminicola]QNH60824.1 hypothetical protein H4317_11560 [Hymenobacter sediminicola]